ncbi:MAG: response regulator, partial [bacterium]|nr:response regulator [bacterium]
MPDKRVLIAEDEDLTRQILKEMLTSMGYEVVSASNGKDALELFNKNPFLVVITDIDMPQMDGNELLSHLNEITPPPLVIVQTVHDELPNVIETMKRGAYDYIIKPLNAGDISMKLERAFETAGLRRANDILRKERIVKLESQLDWLKWNEQFTKRDYNRLDRELFKNLHTGFTQGAGMGALLTLLQLIFSSAVPEDNRYVIDAELFDLMKDSANLAQDTIDTFSEIHNILNNEFDTQRTSITDVHLFLREIINDNQKYADFENQRVLLSEDKSSFKEQSVLIDKKYIRIGITELLINAFKFSKKDSPVLVLLNCDDKNMTISVISDPTPTEKGVIGIPPEYENIIFEPFFRMVSGVFEKYGT